MRRVLPLLVFVVTFPAISQTSNTHAPAKVLKDPPTGKLTGTVLCADTHRPARGATVLIAPVPPPGEQQDLSGGTSAARVGEDGKYLVQSVRPGEYIVIASFPGYLNMVADLFNAAQSQGHYSSANATRARLAQFTFVKVEADKTTTYDLSLTRGGAVNGRVLYSDGAPAVGIGIKLEDASENQASASSKLDGAYSRTVFTGTEERTNDQGSFRISGIKSGSYRIAAVRLDTPPNDYDNYVQFAFGSRRDPASLLVYSGDTSNRQKANTIDIGPGDEVTGIDIEIPLGALFRVHGTLTAVDGRPVNSAKVTLTNDSDASQLLVARAA